jgi:hypothetical protein
MIMSKKIGRFNKQLCENIIANFTSKAEAEKAVLALDRAGFDPQKLSIVGKEYQLFEQIGGLSWQQSKAEVAGGYYWGSLVGGLLGVFAGIAELSLNGVSLVVIAAPMAGVLMGWLIAAVIGGCSDVFGDWKIPTNKVLNSAYSAPTGDFIIWVTGTSEDVIESKQILDNIQL